MYNPDLYAIVFMEVQSMKEALKIQLKILKLSDIKPNFSELARQYGLDRRTVKKYYDGYEGKPKHHNKPSRLDEHYELIKTKLSLRGANVRAVYEFIVDEVTYLPNEMVTLEGEDKENFDKLLTMLDDVEDVQKVYHNVNM